MNAPEQQTVLAVRLQRPQPMPVDVGRQIQAGESRPCCNALEHGAMFDRQRVSYCRRLFGRWRGRINGVAKTPMLAECIHFRNPQHLHGEQHLIAFVDLAGGKCSALFSCGPNQGHWNERFECFSLAKERVEEVIETPRQITRLL
ncbi:hypothetical protein G6F63_014370 [Rhizopus arrhizus]|nr:hypothetical protein G6F63_014370 [Rhizopus arrhizus]